MASPHTLAFAGQVRRFIEKSNLNMDLALRHTLVALSAEILEKTPVDTGRLSGNWQFGVDRIPDTLVEVPGAGEGEGAAVKARRKEELAGDILGNGDVRMGRVFYLINNLPYAPVVEYGLYPNPPKHGGLNDEGQPRSAGGFSTQAPQGMVRLTAAEFQNYVRDTLAQLGD